MAVVRDLRFGISRNHGGPQILDGARQFVSALGLALGTPVRVQVAFDYDHLLKAVRGGGVDIAWLPPLLQVQAQDKTLHAAVCDREGRLTYRSALLVREDSAAASVDDLRGARAAWVDRHSAAGYVLPRMYLTRCLGEDALGKEKFVGTFGQACAAVSRGEADVCAVFLHHERAERSRAMDEVQRTIGPNARSLRVLDVTEPIPHDGIAVALALAAEDQARICGSLHGLHSFDDGRKALFTLFQATRLVPPSEEIHKALGRLAVYFQP